MTRSRMTIIASRLLVTLALAVPLCGGPALGQAVDAIDWDGPITISASTIGRFSKGHSWYLSVNSAGQAELTIATFPHRTRRILITGAQLRTFRRALRQEHFFELGGAYGEHVIDGSTSRLPVTLGDRTKAMEVRFLMNWVANDKATLREPSRAVRLLMIVRGWIEDAEAVDLRPYDQKVLDAAKG